MTPPNLPDKESDESPSEQLPTDESIPHTTSLTTSTVTQENHMVALDAAAETDAAFSVERNALSSPSTGVSPSKPNNIRMSSPPTTPAAPSSQKTKSTGKKPPKSMPNIPAATPRGENSGRIRLGICAMDKKARSKPMAEILSRLDENLFCVIFFGDNVILNHDITDWPEVDTLVAFFSTGFPLAKAKEYVALRRPFILNDLEMQEVLQDRRRVYDLLEGSGIDVPRHVYLSRDDYVSTGTGDGNGNRDPQVQEFDDHIEVNGVTVHKPFVEKPVNAEDHNISIYYPTSAGGGCKKLFRKVGNRSSEFYPDINEVRRDGSYIYEEFVATQGTDVKMYTVGPDYGHAEARKSPTVDGKVERNADGKEVRFPVILTFREKEIARRIVLVFKQWICGFDILRVQKGHSVVSYVCDVNGWSFVKNSRKYYDDCSQILSEHILAALMPTALKTFSTLDPLVTTSLDLVEEPTVEKREETFLSRAARMLKGEPSGEDDEDECERSVTALSVENGGAVTPSHLEVNGTQGAATTLVEGALPVRDLPDILTSEPASMCQSASSSVMGEMTEQRREVPRSGSISQACHQEELRCVVAIIRHGDRTPKQKLKLNMSEPHILKYFHDHSEDCKKDLKVKAKAPMTEFLETVRTTLVELPRTPGNESLRYQLMHMKDVLERWKIAGLNRKLQIKPRKFESYKDESGATKERCKSVQLILKWGGNLTLLGQKQSIALGQRLRHEMYPDAPGGGILRLHSTFRHDLKIKTSDEGRVMKTAAAFAKGLLELEGDLPPILVSLVHKEQGSLHMLDPSGNKEVKLELDVCKEKITANLQRDIDVTEAKEDELETLVGPEELTSLRNALTAVGNPRRTLQAIHRKMGELLVQLEEMLGTMGSGDEKRNEHGEGLQGEGDEDLALSGVKLYKGETLLELTERWRFIYDRLYDEESDTFDLSRIPDVHDNVRFDVLHNPHLGLSSTLHGLYELVKSMADCVVPQEYGTTIAQKRSVGVKICQGLLEKIKFDLALGRTDNQVDMRYMINMAYSADLPINTMGRRIRTRLYFTSESHLHTVLNVLRFANRSPDSKPILSDIGMDFVNSTPELCYLTQIVIRVFEDNRPEMREDPRRFRVEILFSPGADSTPIHLDETDRDYDDTRIETAGLTMIGREGLTCEELEVFFEEAIVAGCSNGDLDRHDDIVSHDRIDDGIDRVVSEKTAESPDLEETLEVNAVNVPVNPTSLPGQQPSQDVVPEDENPYPALERSEHAAVVAARALLGTTTPNDFASSEKEVTIPETGGAGEDPDDLNDEESVSTDDTLASEIVRKVIARKTFWTTVAIGSFLLGASCLLLAMRLTDDSRQRRWSTRRHGR